MAFIGILLVSIIFFILDTLTIISAGVFLVAGFLFLRKAHKIIAIILFILSGLNLLVFTVWKIYTSNEKKIVRTPVGNIKVECSVCTEFKKYIDKNNYKKMDKFLEKYPYMIYYPVHNNYGLLDYSLFSLNTEMMQCAVNHGAVFDDPFIYSSCSWNNSLDGFWYFAEKQGYITSGVTTDKVINTVRFAIEHGAEVTGENFNFYEKSEKWVRKDGVVSEKDKKLLNLIEKYRG
ncbi:MAG: hypothetical protein K2G36_07965 [Ruminococcus sp.]|nr:hypothetical protein [Ruminococcus sp.]